MSAPWLKTETSLPIHFSSPFKPTVRLKTSREKKYIEVTLRKTSAMEDKAVVFKRPMFKVLNDKEGAVQIKLIGKEEDQLVSASTELFGILKIVKTKILVKTNII